jgi:hypothetical protein
VRVGEFIYSKERLIYMLKFCLGLNIDMQASFDEIRKILIDFQTKA